MIRQLTYLILLCSSTALLAQSHTRMVGNKSFELSNHLGNVLEVTTDRKVQQNTEAEIVAFNDYYPYGMLMQGRFGQEKRSNYRYAFQGQEKDDGVKGVGNSYNYTYRMHDSRLGRFFAVDPLASKYPHYSTYQFSGNKLIAHVEFEGLEERYFTGYLLNQIFGSNKIGVAMMAGDPSGQSLHVAIESEALSISVGAGLGAGLETEWGQSKFSLRGTLIDGEFDVISGNTRVSGPSVNLSLAVCGNNFVDVSASTAELNLNLYGGWLKKDENFFQSFEFMKYEAKSNIGVGGFSVLQFSSNGSTAKVNPSGRSTLFNHESNANLSLQYDTEFSPEKYGVTAQFGLKLSGSFNLTQYNTYVEKNIGNLPLERAMRELKVSVTASKAHSTQNSIPKRNQSYGVLRSDGIGVTGASAAQAGGNSLDKN